MSEPIKTSILGEGLRAELKELLREALREELRASRSGDSSGLLNAEQAAEFLGYSRDWVYRNWQRIGGRKIGKRGVRFSRKELEAWAASRTG